MGQLRSNVRDNTGACLGDRNTRPVGGDRYRHLSAPNRTNDPHDSRRDHPRDSAGTVNSVTPILPGGNVERCGAGGNPVGVPREVGWRVVKVIPRLSTTNDDVEHFATPLADRYEEIVDLLASAADHWRWPERERVFWETIITRDRYEIRMATPVGTAELAQQQVESIWPTAILEQSKDDHLGSFGIDTDGWQLRLRFPHFLSLSSDRRKLAPLPQLLELSRQLRDDDAAIVQFGFQAAEPDWWKDAAAHRRDFDRAHKPRGWRKVGHPSEATEQKLAGQGFDFCLRVLVRSTDAHRRQRLGRGVCAALASLNADNQLESKRVPGWRLSRFLRDVRARKIKVPFFSSRRDIITPVEIGRLIQLPPKSLQQEYMGVSAVTHRESKAPLVVRKGGMKLGSVAQKDGKYDVCMPTSNHDELCLPRVVIGGMGSGKTRGYGANLMVEAVTNGFGALSIDPAKGEIGNEVEAVLPPEKVKRIRIDGTTPIALDFCEVKYSPRARNRLANSIISFFNSATDEAGAQTARYLRAAIMAMQTSKLSEIMRIFEDDEYRGGCIEKMPEGIHRSTLNDFGEMSDGKRGQILGPIYNRLDTILGDECLAECFESDNSLDMVQLMSNPQAVIIDVPKTALGPEGVDLIINLLSVKIDLAMTLREEAKQFPFFVVYDEPHQFLRSARTWKSAAVESRKWRVGYVWMFHSWEQIPHDLAEIIRSAGPHYHIYRASKRTFNELREELDPFTIEEYVKMPKWHALNVLRVGEEQHVVFMAHMTAPPSVQHNTTESITPPHSAA